MDSNIFSYEFWDPTLQEIVAFQMALMLDSQLPNAYMAFDGYWVIMLAFGDDLDFMTEWFQWAFIHLAYWTNEYLSLGAAEGSVPETEPDLGMIGVLGEMTMLDVKALVRFFGGLWSVYEFFVNGETSANYVY